MMARTPAHGSGPHPPTNGEFPNTAPPPPPYHRPPPPLTMIAPAEALARVYAAAYLPARNAGVSYWQASDEAVAAVRKFCALCREKFEEPE